jgi:hypothetical protein
MTGSFSIPMAVTGAAVAKAATLGTTPIKSQT